MLPASLVHQTKTIITHRNSDGLCPDAIASVILLRDLLPFVRVLFMNYGSPEHRDLVAEDGQFFVDITPPAARIGEFIAKKTLIADHHRSAEALVRAFGDRGVFADEDLEPGISAAMLVFSNVWMPHQRGQLHGPTLDQAFAIAERAGIRDLWRKENPLWREACAQAAAFRFWPYEGLNLGPDLDEKLALGPTLLLREEARAREQLAGAVRILIRGEPVLFFDGSSHEASNVADIAEEHFVVAWHFEGAGGERVLRVSLRSRGARSCIDVAALHDGGGHRGAGGFLLPVRPETPNPYAYLEAILANDFERLARAA